MQSEFLRLTKDDARVTPDQRIFLSKAYNFKAVADYDAGSSRDLSAEDAIVALEQGRAFVDTVRRLLTLPNPT